MDRPEQVYGRVLVRHFPQGGAAGARRGRSAGCGNGRDAEQAETALDELREHEILLAVRFLTRDVCTAPPSVHLPA